jgi:LuxR family maltose regulon positive regulatory protein
VQQSTGLFSEHITERELEVLRLLDSEFSNREIAKRLFVSLDTVKSHTMHISTLTLECVPATKQ